MLKMNRNMKSMETSMENITVQTHYYFEIKLCIFTSMIVVTGRLP